MTKSNQQIQDEELDDTIIDDQEPDLEGDVDGEGDEEIEQPEDRARRMGWKPKDECRGPDGKWVDADEFLRRADEDPKEVRKVNHVLMRKVQKLEKGIDDILSHQQRELNNARKQEYDRAHADLKRAHDAAVADGDVVKADKVWQARESLAKQQVSEAGARPVISGDDESIVDAWKAQNADWYGSNYKATKEANEYEDWLAKKGVPLAQRLKETAEYIRSEVVRSPVRRPADAPSSVSGHNNNGTVRHNRKAKPGSYEALTPAARAECDRTIRSSRGKITKEGWMQFATPEMFQQ